MISTIFDTLDHHNGTSTAVLTAALVLVTTYYAVTNRQAVDEMKAARDAALLPKLALEFHRLGPNVVDLAIRSVGPGAALNIDVHAEWVPVDEGNRAPKIRWRRNLMSPGEQVELFPPGNLNGNLDVLPSLYRDVHLRGTMEDVTGKRHHVDEVFADITEWRDLLHDAHESWRPPEPERRVADAMYQKFDRPLQDLVRAAQEVARGVSALGAPKDAD